MKRLQTVPGKMDLKGISLGAKKFLTSMSDYFHQVDFS